MKLDAIIPQIFFFALLSFSASAQEKTAFQTAQRWMPEIDVRADVAIVYGVNNRGKANFEERVKSWRDRGYNVHFMTGIAWGEYDEYFLGKWDGQGHLGEGQQMKNGDTIWHGKNVPYIVPVASFIKYMKERVIKRVIDAGITSIYLEEPEFWARAGYSEVFKQEWQKYYGFPWRPQDASPENTYLSSKLKYHLYYNTIKEVSEYAKEYGKSINEEVKVYIPTHSLVNYSSWQIVSPEASLASLPSIDGYIAQVWTGTSREPTFFNGIRKERVFENAFLEYGSMVSMTAPTKRKLFFLTDPIEDRAKDWADYKRNYEATFTAKLLYPMVSDYEVMPWPERIYTHPYKLANSDEKVLIPKYYSTQMQVMVNALNAVQNSSEKVNGTHGIGVLMGNSLMFQRFPVHDNYNDPQFSNFYGQTLPLVKRGVPVETVHMENLSYAATLQNIKVLVMSYANMKPDTSGIHRLLTDWVKNGGVLVYCGRDNDPYQKVMEWWNMNGNNYAAPSAHLFNMLGGKVGERDTSFAVGKGKVYVMRRDPKEFAMEGGADDTYVKIVQQAYGYATKKDSLLMKNNFVLKRGPYEIISVMDESVSKEPFKVNELIIDLFDPKIPVLTDKVIEPGKQAFLYNIGRINNKKIPQVLASASRNYDEVVKNNSYKFVAKSPANTINVMRIYLPKEPKTIVVTNDKGKKINAENCWDKNSKTLFLSFDNSPEGISVSLQY